MNTANLTPYFESIIVARKPLEGSCIDNILTYGVGAINIAECRIPFVNDTDYKITADKNQHADFGTQPLTDNVIYGDYSMVMPRNYSSPEGRYPSNVILTYNEDDYDEVCGGMPNSGSGNGGAPYSYAGKEYNNKDTSMFNGDKPQAPSNYNDNGSASRYFYNAKVTERDQEQVVCEVTEMENTEEQKIRLYAEGKEYKLYQGSMLDMLDVIEPNSIDSIVTDPPYELGFMGKLWDKSGIAFQQETWEKCLKVLKPGGYLLAFGASRNAHRVACAIEDAGFEIRDTIMWLYGCLSEDTEILTQDGFKQYNKITDSDKIRVYDVKTGVYKWEIPQRWNVYKTEQDSCYRIKSDSTDQLVSRNHRCLVEREGKLVFEFAENLRSMERVPVLSYDIPYLQEGGRNILLTDLLWQDERLAKELFSELFRKEKSEEISLWGEQPKLEGWSNLSEQKRELFKSENKICQVSEQVYIDGEKRWICDGTQTACSTADQSTSITDRGCASQESQCGGQQIGKSDAVCNKSRSQTVREWKSYTTTLATVTKEAYSGIIFCPTVSTGCFVARRNGKVFITGNSGFPKGMNIGKGIEAKLTSGSANTQEFKNLDGEKVASGNWGIDNMQYAQGNRSSDYSADEHLRTDKVNYTTEEGQRWDGWNTALKPAYEPITIARKPIDGSCVDNVLTYGVGAINIDECRVGTEEVKTNGGDKFPNLYGDYKECEESTHQGRYPANVILTYDETDQKEVCGGMPESKGASSQNNFSNGHIYRGQSLQESSTSLSGYREWYNDEGSASRYFYCAKASTRDRDEGLDAFEVQKTGDLQGGRAEGSAGSLRVRTDGSIGVNPYAGNGAPKRNTHSTVKPTDLMQYLVRLVTPKGGTILDPFNGSGSTGKAIMYENHDRKADYKYIGIDLSGEYLAISEARIKYAITAKDIVPEKPISEEKKKIINNQMNLFDIPQ